MDREVDNAEASTRHTLGQTLAAERERQGLSRADAAQRLHMSAYQIEALETGDFSRLPRGTFLRGFVRNYAKVLGLAPDALMPLLVEDAPRDGRPGIVVPTQNIRFDPLHERLQSPYVKAATIAFVVVAIALAAMYWWLFIRPAPPGSAARRPVETPPAAAVAIPETAPAIAPMAVAPPPPAPSPAMPAVVAATNDGTPAKTAAVAQKAAPPAILVAGEGPARLKFRFHGDSWVEIRDARGKVILSKLNPAGSEAEVAGQPPLNVTIGNAPEVELFYNDREFDLESHTKVAVARFTVE